MPGFPPSATVVTSNSRLNVAFRDNVRQYRRSIGYDAIAPTVVGTEIDAWAAAAGQLTTTGLEYYEFKGERKQISIGSIAIFDELYSGSTNMVFNFQRANDLDLQQFRLPGINAAYVKDGTVLKDVSDPTVGADISAFLSAHLNLYNKGLSGGALYAFVGAFLDTSGRSVSSIRPQDSQIVEPDTGDGAGLPDADTAP